MVVIIEKLICGAALFNIFDRGKCFHGYHGFGFSELINIPVYLCVV